MAVDVIVAMWHSECKCLKYWLIIACGWRADWLPLIPLQDSNITEGLATTYCHYLLPLPIATGFLWPSYHPCPKRWLDLAECAGCTVWWANTTWASLLLHNRRWLNMHVERKAGSDTTEWQPITVLPKYWWKLCPTLLISSYLPCN